MVRKRMASQVDTIVCPASEWTSLFGDRDAGLGPLSFLEPKGFGLSMPRRDGFAASRGAASGVGVFGP